MKLFWQIEVCVTFALITVMVGRMLRLTLLHAMCWAAAIMCLMLAALLAELG